MRSSLVEGRDRLRTKAIFSLKRLGLLRRHAICSIKRATICEKMPSSRWSAWRSVACPLPRMIISPPWLLIGVPSCSP